MKNLCKSETLASSAVKRWGGLVIVVVLLTCSFVAIDITAFNHNIRYDLSQEKKYAISERSRKIIEGLQDDVRTVVFYKMGNRANFQGLLEQLAGCSKRFTYRLVDLDRNPGKAKVWGIAAYGAGFCEYKGKRNRFRYADEKGIVNSIAQLTWNKKKTAYFTCGHGEKEVGGEYSHICDSLEDDGWKIASFLSIKEDIPGDATALIIGGPEKDFLDYELETISEYLEEGGKVIAMLEPFTELPRLTRFFRKYGIELRQDMIVDMDNKLSGGGDLSPLVFLSGDHQITYAKKAVSIFSTARSVNAISDSPSGINITCLARSSSQSWSNIGRDEIESGDVSFSAEVDRRGPICVAALAEIKQGSVSGFKKNGYIVCFGDSDFISNSNLKFFANEDLFMDTVTWLAMDEDLILLRQAGGGDFPYNYLKGEQGRWLFCLTVIIQPAFFLVIGIALYFFRKRRG